jgi:hypothetical protein
VKQVESWFRVFPNLLDNLFGLIKYAYVLEVSLTVKNFCIMSDELHDPYEIMAEDEEELEPKPAGDDVETGDDEEDEDDEEESDESQM